MTTNYFILLPILVLHLKPQTAILDGVLCYCVTSPPPTCPEHIAVHRDVVAEDLGENPPCLQQPVQCLVMPPCPPLHHPILCWIRVVPGALSFVGVVAGALVGLDPLAWLNVTAKNLNVRILTGKVRTLDPHQIHAPGGVGGFATMVVVLVFVR